MSNQSVFGKNQQTIEFLRTHDFFRAVESALDALESCHHYLFSHHGQENTSGYEDNTTLDQKMFTGEALSSADIAPSTFVYSEGIPIPVQAERDYALTATILVFNAALAHHLLAINLQNEASSDLLRKAKKLYSMAHDSQDGDCNFLFRLAVVNNVGMIDQALGNIESAKTCFEYNLSMLMFLLDQGYEPSLLSRAHVFLTNVPVWNINNVAPAA